MVTVAREKEVGTNGFTVKKPSSVNWNQFNSKDSVEVAKGLSNDDNTSRLRHYFLFDLANELINNILLVFNLTKITL